MKGQTRIFESGTENYFSAIAENCLDPLWVLDSSMHLVDFNAACNQLVHKFYNRNVCHFMQPGVMFGELGSVEWMENYKNALSGITVKTEMKLSYNKETFYYEVSVSPVIVQNKIDGATVIAHDITAFKRNEEQLNSHIHELSTFMYKATHDLRSPLISMMGLVNLAGNEIPVNNHELKTYFSMISSSAGKMDRMLVELVDITSVSRKALNNESIDFERMIDDITGSLMHYPMVKAINFQKSIKGNGRLNADYRLLYSVVQNLIDNAIKYRQPGNEADSKIKISIECNSNSAIINISDNGIGIPTAFQEKVFEMFYRASDIASGTGLGLYMVKVAVEKMGGKIMLSSVEGKGTSITIKLPNIVAEI